MWRGGVLTTVARESSSVLRTIPGGAGDVRANRRPGSAAGAAGGDAGGYARRSGARPRTDRGGRPCRSRGGEIEGDTV